jgi:hypothetical protein
MCSVPENHPYLIDLVVTEYIHPEDLSWSVISAVATSSENFGEFKRYLNWELLSANPNMIGFLSENIHRVNWKALSGNPAAFHLLAKNIEKIHWPNLCGNPNAIKLLEMCPVDKIDLYKLATNNNAVHILAKHANRILNLDIWAILAVQQCEEAVELVIDNLYEGVHLVDRGGGFIPSALAENPFAIGFVEQQLASGQFYWEDIARSLCRNPCAIYLLEMYVDDPAYASHIDWNVLAENPCAKNLVVTHMSSVSLLSLAFNHSQWAVDIIESQIDEIDSRVWYRLSGNPTAIEILKRYPDKITLEVYLENIPACEHTWWHDYEFIRSRNQDIHETLISVMHHPNNLANGKLANWGFDMEDCNI